MAFSVVAVLAACVGACSAGPEAGSGGDAASIGADEFYRLVRTEVPRFADLPDSDLDQTGSGICEDAKNAREDPGVNPAQRVLNGLEGLPLSDDEKVSLVRASLARFCPEQQERIGKAALGVGSGGGEPSQAGRAASPPKASDAKAEQACTDLRRLLALDPAGWTDKGIAAIEGVAVGSSNSAMAEAGQALGRARVVWVRDKALYTSAEDQFVVEAQLTNALFDFRDACTAAGLTGT